MRVEVRPEARIELREAVFRYDSIGAELGADYRNEFDSAVERILAWPRAHSFYQQTRVRIARMRRFPYSIYYWEIEGRIEIIAISHHSQRPAYWLDRL